MPEESNITIDVVLDENTFRKFAVFDNLLRERRWLPLAAFPSMMLAFSLICFFAAPEGTSAGLLGGVLLAIGIILPLAYLRMFFVSVSAMVKRYGLSTPQHVYTLSLSEEPDGVYVTNPKGEAVSYEWGKLYGVYRVTGCTYLYAARSKAFLLPDSQTDAEALWALLSAMLPVEKLFMGGAKK